MHVSHLDPDRALWVDRLLERRSDLTLIELEQGRSAVIRRDELLVSIRDIEAVAGRARQWIDGIETDEASGLVRCRLRPGRDVQPAELARDLAGATSNRKLAVTPNHLMSGSPGVWGGGPADTPAPIISALDLPVVAQRTARPFTVAVLDTGVSAHPWFEPTDWFSAVEAQDIELLDELPKDHLLDAQAGHGTFIIGVIMQAAPTTYVLAQKLLSSDGVCDEFTAVRRLRQLKSSSESHGRQLDLVNLSFGGYTYDDEPSPHVADAIAGLGSDTVVVACAGNDGTDRPFWPAALPSVIAVGALDSDASDRAPFSNFGSWVDACTVGERVSSSFVTFDGPIPSTGDFDDDRFQGFAQWSGTSFAAPRVAGAIAALATERGISATEAAALVLDPLTTTTMPELGVVVATA